ncbi:hypothetical protein AALP_AA7G209500 [Arabis alpina]|uniref:RING-type E3 ubiquitin transferase n=1 Tax=Arabis alpina TaxID=50452 RepID=A0A087GJI9_ARAAL|nr:hypothetical protein AALP_AA7G209500 [Arabis alpina]
MDSEIATEEGSSYVEDDEIDEEFAGSAEFQEILTICLSIRALATEASSLFTRIVSFNGLITAIMRGLQAYFIILSAFLRSFGEAQMLFLSRISTTVILIDCLLFDDVVGMLDQVFHMVVNRLIVLARNLKFLGVVIFVPFTLGRVVLYHVSLLFGTSRGPAVTASMYFTDTGLSLENITLKSALTSVSNLTNEGHQNGRLGQLTDMMKVNASELNGANNTLSVAADLLKGSSKLYDVTTLTVGYMFIVFSVFLYLWIIALIRYAKDACTIQMSHRVQFLSICPLTSSLVHWVVGFIYMLHIFIFQDPLEEVLRPEVLSFLVDPPNDSIQYLIDDPVQMVVREALLEVAQQGSLIFVQVFLPAKLAIRMAPSVFPLDISVSDPFIEIPAGILLFQICISFIMEHFKVWITIKSLLRCWFTGVGRQNRAQVMQVGGPDRAMAALPAADDLSRSLLRAGNVNTGEEYEDDVQVQKYDSQYNSVLRIILLLLVACVTFLLFNSALIVVTVLLGRALFSAIPLLPITHGIKCNDLYAFAIGTCAFWTTISGARYAIEHVKSKRTSVLLNQLWKWCAIFFKSSVLSAIWVFIILVLIGLLFELLVIVPIKIPVDERPVFLLYQDWALGLIFLKIGTWLLDSNI